jgi:hypothetical protein
MVGLLIRGLQTTMDKRSLRQCGLLAGFTVLALLLFAAPSSPKERPVSKVQIRVNIMDTGRTVPLAVGQRLIVTVPLARYDDATWRVVTNSGPGLKLIAGPDTRQPNGWTPYTRSTQVFYFLREAPGTVNLVLEQNYASAKPMILKVVDR